MQKHGMLKMLLLGILFSDCCGMEIANTHNLEAPVTIVLAGDQERTIAKKYLVCSPVLKPGLELAGTIQEKIAIPIKPNIWDKVIVPTLQILEELHSKKLHNVQERWEKKERMANVMVKFSIEGNDQAIMDSANSFDFLALDEMLDYRIFGRIAFIHEFKDLLSALHLHNDDLAMLNPGLAEKILLTQPKALEVYESAHKKSLGTGYGWHEIADDE